MGGRSRAIVAISGGRMSSTFAFILVTTRPPPWRGTWTDQLAAGATARNHSADVSHSPRMMANNRPPTTGSTQVANLVDRTTTTLATTAPYNAEPSNE